MRVLVTWGSKHGGTEGIGRILGAALTASGLEVVASPAEKVVALDSFDAVIVGGALYANRWPASVRRFINGHVRQLRKRPVWFFSSGPLNDSAEHAELPPPTQVAVLAERIGAKGHITFGGRLEAGAKGFPESAMAKHSSGDWRNPGRVRAWAAELAAQLPGATPGKAIDHPGRSLPRLFAHALVGWGLCAGTMGGLEPLAGHTAALAIHALAAPLFFLAIAWHYFRARGAREPLPTSLAWTAIVALLDLTVIAGAVQRSPAMFASIAGTWLPLALIFVTSWATGAMMSMLPLPQRTKVPHPEPATAKARS